MSNSEISLSAADLASILATRGTLDSKVSQIFKSTGDKALSLEAKEITLNFRNLQTLDASTAGTLMFVNFAAKEKGKQINITEANASVQQVLNRANLGALVTMK